MEAGSFYCPHCGGAGPSGAKFCPHCGGAVAGSASNPQQSAGATSAVQRNAVEDAGSSAPGGSPSPLKSIGLPQAAPVGKRLTAAFLDVVLAIVLLQLLFRTRSLGAMRKRVFLLLFIPAIYMVIRDSLAGKSLGKILLGLTTYNLHERKPADFADSVLRNWFFAILLLPPSLSILRITISLGMVAFAVLSLAIALQIAFGSGRRIGDGQANTLVVEDRALRGT
jgi:hypothetical protein